MGIEQALIEDMKLYVGDTIKGWSRANLGPLAKFYGFMDGPLDEDRIDELIYIEESPGKRYMVIPRSKGETGVSITNGNQLIIDSTGRFEGFDPALGGYVVSDEDRYDVDFTKFGSAASFGDYPKLRDVTTARKEFGDDELRWRTRNLTPIGTDSFGRNVYVSYPKKLDIGQGLYFTGQAIFFSGTYKLFKKLVGKYMKVELLEAWWEKFYRTSTDVLNEWLGLPKQMEFVRA
ncbi:MAG: hypothetical protein GTN76_00655 [Candidatus Aenigmarchaeota archaeon]|nr:hypothetical protein [Candidatus Aenigmarchaeota archaeon]